MNGYSLSEEKIRQVVEEWQTKFDAIPDFVSTPIRNPRPLHHPGHSDEQGDEESKHGSLPWPTQDLPGV